MISKQLSTFYIFYIIEDKKKMASKKIAFILGKLYSKFADTAITRICSDSNHNNRLFKSIFPSNIISFEYLPYIYIYILCVCVYMRINKCFYTTLINNARNLYGSIRL